MPAAFAYEFSLYEKVREAAVKLLEALVARIQPAAVALALGPLFEGIACRKWEIQKAALVAVSQMASNKKQRVGIGRELRLVIPSGDCCQPFSLGFGQ